MSHGVHAVQHEVEHQIKHEEGSMAAAACGGGHDSQNKKIALVISVLALFLAFSETLGKSAQTARSTTRSKPRTCGISSRPRPSAARSRS